MEMSNLQFVITIFIIIGVLGLRLVQEYERSIIFCLGRYSRIAGQGLYWIIPLIEWQKKVDIRPKPFGKNERV